MVDLSHNDVGYGI